METGFSRILTGRSAPGRRPENRLSSALASRVLAAVLMVVPFACKKIAEADEEIRTTYLTPADPATTAGPPDAGAPNPDASPPTPDASAPAPDASTATVSDAATSAHDASAIPDASVPAADACPPIRDATTSTISDAAAASVVKIVEAGGVKVTVGVGVQVTVEVSCSGNCPGQAVKHPAEVVATPPPASKPKTPTTPPSREPARKPAEPEAKAPTEIGPFNFEVVDYDDQYHFNNPDGAVEAAGYEVEIFSNKVSNPRNRFPSETGPGFYNVWVLFEKDGLTFYCETTPRTYGSASTVEAHTLKKTDRFDAGRR